MRSAPARAVLLALLAAGCDWVALASHALTYDTVAAGEAANVVASDAWVYATLGATGLLVIDPASGRVDTIAPPAGLGSVDDVALDGDRLFVLDAREPGAVAMLSLADAARPRLLGASHPAEVGPFSGVSARDGIAVVSGGTSRLAAYPYDAKGLAAPAAFADLGRGQPDVLVGAAGLLFVSTHYRGPNFGLDIAQFPAGAASIALLARLPIDGAGFTTGGSRPATFPIELTQPDDSTVLVAHARGVAVVRIADPRRPAIAAIVDVGGPAVSVEAHGTQAAVAVGGRTPSVVVLDLAYVPARVVRRIALARGTKPAGIAFSKHYIIAAARDRGVLTWSR
jgi:hypothetical protein